MNNRDIRLSRKHTIHAPVEQRGFCRSEFVDTEHHYETDYTGRWRIDNRNGVSLLYIECFEIVPYDKQIEVEKDGYKKVYDTWWSQLIGGRWVAEKVKGYKKVTGYRADVNWISENDLILSISTTNECNKCYG